MTNSTHIRLGDVAILSRDAVDPSNCAGEPYVGLEHIEPGSLRISAFGTATDVSSVKSRFLPGDILYGKLRPYFRKVAQTDRKGICSTDYWVIRARPPVDPRYLFYCLASPSFTEFAVSSSKGTRMPRAAWDHVEKWPMYFPSLEEQKEIARTLTPLDLKIESNLELQNTIAQLVPTLFRRYCVPIDAEQPLSELANIVKGVPYRSTDLSESDVAMVTLKSFSRDGGYRNEGLKPFTGRYKPEQVIAPGELAVAQTDITRAGDVVGRAIRVPASSKFKTLVASLDVLILRPQNDVPPDYLYGVLLDERFRQHCRSHSSGTTVLHLASDAVPSYPVKRVDRLGQLDYANRVGPLLQFADSVSTETELLTSIRDTLLPDLIGGRRHPSGARIHVKVPS